MMPYVFIWRIITPPGAGKRVYRGRKLMYNTMRYIYLLREGIVMQYISKQVVLKEKFIGHDAKNLHLLDDTLNEMAAQGWTLVTMTTTLAGDKGIGGGDRTVFTLVFGR
jgi:hypothetical protein